ncbi:MAG: minC [Gammaproteobacteria bacterium]|jgi:septum site-determining protein MinC|nr:minC [Gammaproteobacteria bacterium]
MQPSSTINTSPAFELKGSMFTLTVLHLLHADLEAFAAQLNHQVQQTPNFFNHMPLVIDLKKVNEEGIAVDLVNLLQHLRHYGVMPVGIRHGNEAQNNTAQTLQLAVLSPEADQRKPTKSAATSKSDEISHHPKNLVISHPVRSGQQVYARNANLVILSSVSHGAELIADGHIHVYGHLWGRALAGVQGDKTARIFCHRLEAELVSIAGYYKLRDDLPAYLEEASIVQIYLEEDEVQVAPVLVSVV